MKMGYVLGAAVLVAGGVALYGGGGSRGPSAAAEPPKPLPAAAVPGNPEEPEETTQLLEGQVLETMAASGYTYLRIGATGTEGTWAAVSETPLKVGDQVRVRSQTVMTDFESKTLNRKFPSIHFGTLDDGKTAAGGGALPPGHPQAGAGPGAGAAAPPGHPTASAAPAAIEVGKVEKAGGPNGRTVQEIFAQKTELAGKKVRVRGVVVKAMGGIMNRTFLHLRDGSGSDQAKNNDLTVTTVETPQKGQTVLLEGVLVLDKDLGAGYKYDALLEDAVSVK